MKREERLQFLGCVTSVFDTPCDAPYTHARRSHDALCQDCLTSSVAKRFMRRYNIVKIDEKELKVYPVLSQVSWFSYFSSSSREHNKKPYVLLAAFIWLSHWRQCTGRPPSVSGGRCWLKSEQRSFVIYRRNTYEQYGGYNLFQNAEFKANFSINVWGKC